MQCVKLVVLVVPRCTPALGAFYLCALLPFLSQGPRGQAFLPSPLVGLATKLGLPQSFPSAGKGWGQCGVLGKTEGLPEWRWGIPASLRL